MEIEQTKQKILLVEDDLPVLNVLADKLTREGFDVIRAMDGEEGLATAEREHPDIILLDILMPKMNGLEMMKKLRTESAWGKSARIILLTNLSPNEEKIHTSIKEYEPADYLVKTNWKMSEVVEKIKTKLAKH